MDNIHNEREEGKIGLNSFLEDFEFPDLEITLKSTIDDLHGQLKAAGEKYEVTKSNPETSDLDNFDMFCLEDDIFSIQERLSSVYEMIIVNDYKELEIKLKSLLHGSLGFNSKGKNFFGFAKDFLKDKGIDLEKIESFQTIDDLRNINNHIKHSDSDVIPDNLRKIAEFSVDDRFGYLHFMSFHRKVKDLRIVFFLSVKQEIYSYLYEFDDLKINKMANDIIMRMDKNIVSKLIQKLNEAY